MIFTNAGQVSLQSKTALSRLDIRVKPLGTDICRLPQEKFLQLYIKYIWQDKEKDVRETKTLTSQTVDKVAKPCRAIKRNSFKHGISFDLS